ncbi:MAG TPA: S8 family serine peptidase, partial [Gaiellaceae bacterium]|nr:S8 family serine peptidase [Gaiellaceae bacterium]
AFDAFDNTLPSLTPVRVAVIDSGIDGSHPEFTKKIYAARSFVGGSGSTDEEGHGTFVAGEIAAAINDQGIAGIAFPAQLIIAKIARADASISVRDEAAAIRWAVKRGAQVINLSLGGLRHPQQPDDSYSQVEANAIGYAYRHGAVLVAAVGNADDAPRMPWPWAAYPAAIPHVIGVSALMQSGNVPLFSDRDKVYNDISAPGQNIFSTLPLALTKSRPGCADQGYSDCGPDEFVHASGTSFAAPQVTAAAALLLALKPALRPDQVASILERSANDVNGSNGCGECPVGRDQYSGWGRLDIAKAIAALNGPLPPPDRFEPNDDAGSHAAQLPASVRRVKATLDFWDDPLDVYRVHLVAGHRLKATLCGPSGATTSLLLWRPGTARVTEQKLRAAQSIGPGSTHRLSFRVPTTGWYYLEAKIASRSAGAYTLTLTR